MGINEYLQVGTRIKQFRKKAGITQREMATRLGLSYSTYSNYENNLREPGINVVENVAKVLGIPITDILGVDSDFFKTAEDFFKLPLEERKKLNEEDYEISRIKHREEIISCIFLLASNVGCTEALFDDKGNPDYDTCLTLFYNLADQLKIFIELINKK